MGDKIAGAGPSRDHELDGGGGHGSSSIFKEQDRLLPIANVGRIMKQNLPPNAKIAKEAKETMQECVSEFISFVTSEASDKCKKERRKTVNGDDICWALGTLGFDEYAPPLKRYLVRYRELEGDQRVHQENPSNSEEQDQDYSFRNNNIHVGDQQVEGSNRVGFRTSRPF